MNTNIGSISHGTLRPQDLVPAFLDCLRDQEELSDLHRKLVQDIDARLDSIEEDNDDEPYYSEQADLDIEELFDALQEYAPSYFYFGAHPGDGSDFGFWLTEDLDAVFDGVTIEDWNDVPIDYEGEILQVNDHGNMSLFIRQISSDVDMKTRTWTTTIIDQEIWSVV